jgi:hypothetical protein
MLKLRMDQEDMDDLHEDMHNLYVKYYDRYKERYETDLELEGTIAVSMLEIVEGMNDVLIDKNITGVIKSSLMENENDSILGSVNHCSINRFGSGFWW